MEEHFLTLLPGLLPKSAENDSDAFRLKQLQGKKRESFA